MKKSMVLLMTAIMLITAGCGKSEAEREEKAMFQKITMEEAKVMMAEQENYILLDVRTQEEYQNGHIPGAICVPNEEIGSTEPEELPDKEQLILVYCRSGNRSKQAAEKLAKLGYRNIVEFGGINDWDGEIATEN